MDKLNQDELRIVNEEHDFIKRCANSGSDDNDRIIIFMKVSKEYNALKHEYERTKYAYEAKAKSSTALAKIEQKNNKVEHKIKSKTYSLDEKIEMTESKIKENTERRDNEIDAIRQKYLAKMEAEINAVNTRCNNYAIYLKTLLSSFHHQKGNVITDLSGNIIEPSSVFDEDTYPVLSKMKYDLNILKIDLDRHTTINKVLRIIHEEREKIKKNTTSTYTPSTRYEPTITLPSELKYENASEETKRAFAPPPPVEDDNISVHTNSSVSDDTEHDSDWEPTEADLTRKRNRMMRRNAIEEKKANRQAINDALAKKEEIKKEEERRKAKKAEPPPVEETNTVEEVKPKKKSLTLKEVQAKRNAKNQK